MADAAQAPVPYVWLATVDEGTRAPARAPDADHRRVREWAWARGALLRRPETPSSLPMPDPSVEASVETALAQARDALVALDVPAVEGALGRAETILREHPTLPQAAWLRAEVERAWANRFARAEPRDDARAARAWKRAAGLDGGRVIGVGEVSFGPAELHRIAVRFEPAADLVVAIDGRAVTPSTIDLAEGEHHVLVRRGPRVVWARWVEVTKNADFVLPSFAEPACTEGDFAGVRIRDGALSARGVTCGRWFVVKEGSLMAQCRREACGPFVPVVDPVALGPRERGRPKEDDGRAPTWLTWTAVGVATVIAGAAFVSASGIFDKPERETRWISGGLKTE